MVTTWHYRWMERLTTSTIPVCLPSMSTSAAKVREAEGGGSERMLCSLVFLHMAAQHLNLKRYNWLMSCCGTKHVTRTHITHTHRKLVLGRITERTFVEVRKVILSSLFSCVCVFDPYPFLISGGKQAPCSCRLQTIQGSCRGGCDNHVILQTVSVQ